MLALGCGVLWLVLPEMLELPSKRSAGRMVSQLFTDQLLLGAGMIPVWRPLGLTARGTSRGSGSGFDIS